MATRLSLNESAEDLMPMTMEISLNQFANPEEEAENIRKFMEVRVVLLNGIREIRFQG